MTMQAPVTFVTEFETGIEREFQRSSTKLLSTIRNKRNVKASTARFHVAGMGTAAKKTRGGDVPLMNADRRQIIVTLETNYAGDYIEEEDLEQMGHDDRDEAVFAGAAALGRKADEIIMLALDTTTTPVENAGGPLTTSVASRANVILQQNDVPFDKQVFGIISPGAYNHMKASKQFSNKDYIGEADLPFMTMTEWTFWNGIYWMPYAGVPGVGTATCKGWVYHSRAVAAAIGHDIRSTIDWQNRQSEWFVNNRFRMGASILMPRGVVEFLYTDNTYPTYPQT
jgi:hypothetical protein